MAGGEADVGLGTDTSGSVRVPASYCGLYGVRPSHERVDLRGCAPMAPSFDTGDTFCVRSLELSRLGFGFAGVPSLTVALVGSNYIDLIRSRSNSVLRCLVASKYHNRRECKACPATSARSALRTAGHISPALCDSAA